MGWQETSAHWGTYRVEVSADGREVVAADAGDPDAAPAIGNVVDAHRHRSRVARPSVRRRWLEGGRGTLRGDPADEYVEVGWDTALDLLAHELERVRSGFGNQAIFGGSYGWGSAGRLHHAQSRLHRFLNAFGGYTRSVNDYSRGASQVLLPHLIGPQATLDLRYQPASWDDIARHTDLLVTFKVAGREPLRLHPHRRGRPRTVHRGRRTGPKRPRELARGRRRHRRAAARRRADAHGSVVRPERAGGRRLRQRQRQRPHVRRTRAAGARLRTTAPGPGLVSDKRWSAAGCREW